MTPYEEDLQRRIEAGEAASENMDAKAYERVFHALKEEPGFKLPSDFAVRVTTQLESQRQTGFSKDYFWFGAGLFFLAIAFLATVLFTGFKLDFGFLNVMSDYKGLAVFGIAFVVFLHWLDKRLIREKQIQR